MMRVILALKKQESTRVIKAQNNLFESALDSLRARES